MASCGLDESHKSAAVVGALSLGHESSHQRARGSLPVPYTGSHGAADLACPREQQCGSRLASVPGTCCSPDARIRCLLPVSKRSACGEQPASSARGGCCPPEAAVERRSLRVAASPLKRLSPTRVLIARDEQGSKRTAVSCLVRPAGGSQIHAPAQKAGIRLPANDPGWAVPGVQLRFKWESSLSGNSCCCSEVAGTAGDGS